MALPPNTTKRRNAAMWIEVTQPEAKKASPAHHSRKEDLPILSLTHFAKTPWVCFGEVKLNSTKLEALIIHNPTASPQTVTVEKLSSDKGFRIEKTSSVVEAGGQDILEITWTPQKSGNIRELLNFRINATYLKQVILLGTALVPKISKERKKKPLKVLHPTNQTYVKATSTSTGGLFVKAEGSVDDIVREMTVASIAKIPHDFRVKCSSAVHDCSPLNLSISCIYPDESNKSDAVFSSPQPRDTCTPEILRAYRNRPKKAAAAHRKAQYNVRLTPEAQVASASDNIAPPSTVKPTGNEIAPTRIPIAVERGSSTNVNAQGAPSPVSSNAPKGYQHVPETSFSELSSSPDRRQTYVAAARSKDGSRNNFKSRAGNRVNVPSSRSPKPKPSISPVDRRQTFVTRSPRDLIPSPDMFYPIIDKSDSNIFSDISDTPERRNTFVKPCPSQSVVPSVTSPVGASWADQCEVLESELIKDLTVGLVTYPLLSYGVPRLEGISKDDHVTSQSPKKSRMPVIAVDGKSKTDPTLSLPGTGRLTAKSKNKAIIASPSSSRKCSVDHFELRSRSDRKITNSVGKSKVGDGFTTDNESKCLDSNASVPRRGLSTYRQTRYSDIIEVDDRSECSGTGLSDSLETVSPATMIKEKSVASSPALNDSLEVLSHVVAHQQAAVEHLPSTLPIPAPTTMLSLTFQSEVPTSVCTVDRVLYIAPQDVQATSSVESVCLSDELIEEQYALAAAVPLPVSPMPAPILAYEENSPSRPNRHPLCTSLLNYDQFCQELPVPAALGSDGDKVCDDEIRRCSTEVKSQCQKESVAHEACRELFPDEGDVKIYFDPEMCRIDAENDDLRRISSGTFIKTPETSPVKAFVPHEEQVVSNVDNRTGTNDVPCNDSKLVPGKRKSDEFSEELQQVSKRLKGPLIQNATSDQEKPLNKAKSSLALPQSSRSNKSVSRVMPSRLKLIKPPATVKALAHHPNPFAAKNAYYDERWAEKQTHGFTRWLNFVLAMPDEFVTGEQAILEHMKSMDVREVTCPSREVLSLREYRAGCSLNRLRRKACSLYQSKEIIMVVNRVEAEIEKGQLSVRKDRALHADIGIRQSLVEMIMGYNSLWLRVGLETVFGVLIPIRDNNEADGLSNFILNYLLNNADLAKEYAHPVVPYLYKPGFAQALKKHTLKKFLLLVFFLDKAKVARLLQYNPCLFNKDAPFKSSKDLLLTFSKDYLHGEGNIIKHLSFIGYKVSVQQNYLDEYDFSVKNLAVDLRNGIRLVKVTELVTHNWRLLNQVRIPSESRLQKLHNVGLVFTAYKSHTGHPMKDVAQKDVVDGHKEKTLCLLWQMLYNLQISELLSESLLCKEISCLESMRHIRGSSQGDSVDMEFFMSSIKELYPEENLQLLLRWCNLICARYGMQVENFTVAFSDGRALCFLINHYFPMLLPYESIKLETTQTYQTKSEPSPNASCSSDDSFNLNWTAPAIAPDKYEALLQHERYNLNLVLQKVIELGGIPLLLKANTVCNTIPDEKVMIGFISYLWNRLWNLAAEVRAARTLQLVWRRRSFTRKKKKQLEVQNKAALILQRTLKRYCIKRRHLSAMVIQNAWRTYQSQMKLHKAASKVQTWYRGFLHKRLAQEFEKKIIGLQSAIRGYFVRSNIQKMKLAKQVKSATLIQATVRCFLARKRYRILLSSVIPLQAACKGHMLRLWLNEELLSRKKMVSSAIVIQRAYRRFAAQKRYQKMLQTIYGLQNIGKGFIVRRQIKLQLKQQRLDTFKRCRAARIIRCYFRNYRKMCKEHISATKIQAVYRGFIRRKAYMAIHSAALSIQKWYRGCRAVRRMQVRYQEQKKAAIYIQAFVRRWLDRKQYCAMRTAAVKIQANYRGLRQRKGYALLRYSACKIQRWFRSCHLRQKFCQTRMAAVKIQRWYSLCKQARLDRKSFLARKVAVMKLQARTRGLVVFRLYKRMKMASICIQAYYRGYVQKKKFKSMVCAAILIQSLVRRHRKRKEYLDMLHAAKTIQQYYKSWQLMRMKRGSFLEIKKSTIIIQSQVRMWLMQKNYSKKKGAVAVIQAAVRGYLQRKHYQAVMNKVMKIQQWYRNRKEIRLQRLLFLQSNAIRIQSFYRMHLMCHKYKVMRAAAIKIQAAFRAHRQKLHYQQFRQKIVKIQAAYRGHIEQMSYNKKRQAALVIQHWYLLKLQGKRERELFLQQRKAVIAIQALVRKWLSVQKYLRLKIATVKIQSTIRSFLCRKRYRTIGSATLKIQTYFRVYQQRQSFLRMRHSALVIQRWYRCSKETRERRCLFLHQKTAAIVIQAWFRKSAALLHYHRLWTSVVKLQSYVRGYQQRKRYVAFRLNTIKMQRWYKNLLIGKQIRKTFSTKKTAALAIQVWFRNWSEARRQRQSFLKQKRAACAIQRWYKNCLITNLQRQAFLIQKHSVLIIQHWYRNFKRGRSQRKSFLIQRDAAVCIRRWYKNCVLSRNQRKSFLQQKNAAVAIQLWHKTCCLGRSRRKCFLAQKEAAVHIQRWYRSCILSKYQRKSFLCQKEAAVAIQQWYRNCNLGGSQQTLYLMQREAVIFIQRWRRNCVLCTKQRKSYLQQKDAAVAIQKWYRHCCLGRSQRKSFLNQREAIVCIQQWYRNLIVSKNQRQLFLKQKAAAAVIQRCYRNFAIRRIQQKLFLQKHSSASSIQQWYRNCVASRSQRKLYLQQKDACVVIQKWFRCCIVARKIRERFLSQRNAAITIQQYFRNCRESQRERQWFLHYRASCIIIQCWYKKCILGRVQHKSYLQQNRSACTIQQWYRNCIFRRQQRQIFLAQKNSSLTIQRWYRNSIASRSQRQSFLKLRSAACAIQLWYRHCMVSRQQRWTFLEWRCAASAIQYWYKNCVVSRNQRRSFLQQKQAASVIQRWVRNLWIGRLHRQSFRKQKGATIAVQKWYRSCVMANLQRQNFLQTRNATVVIQRWYRGCVLAKHDQDLYSLRRKSAITIQQWYRNNMVGKYQRQSFLQKRHAAVIIQRWYRNGIETKHQRRSFLNYRDAALAVQRWYRSCTLAKHEHQLFFQYKKAAVTIQQWYRTSILTRQQRQHFLEIKNAVIMVQACVRRWLVVQRFQLINKAAVIIQSSFRSYRQRKFYTALKCCVVKLQNIVRVRIQRKLAAILIQRWYRHFKYEKRLGEELRSQKLAAVTIQTCVRRWMVKKKIKCMTDAAILLQRYFRVYVHRKHFLRQRKAIITIQTAFRCWKSQTRFIRMKTAAVIIQSRYRSHALRKKFLNLRDSAIKIQTQYYTYRMRRRFREKRLAAVVIQSWFRLKRSKELLYFDYRWEQWDLMQNAARMIQVAYRKYHARKSHDCHNRAAVIIQAAFRGYSERAFFRKQKCSAVKIQRWFRICLRHKLAKEKAAEKIQSFVRMCVALKKYKQVRNSAVIIQNTYRSHLQRQLFKKLKIAAIICQSKYRGRVQRLYYMHTVSAVKSIQKWYRVCRMRRAERQQKLAEVAATKVQSFMKMWICKKRYGQFRHSALVVQNTYRMHLQRQSYIKQKHAAIIIQRWYRRLALKKCKIIYHCVCLIQAAVRVYLCRKAYLRLKCAAVVIQQCFRLNCEGRKDRNEFQRLRNAAVKIQCLYRSHFERKRFLVIRRSTITIQSFFRMRSCQRNYQIVRSNVIIVQRWYRHVKEDQVLKWKAAVRIQAWFRMCLIQKVYLAIRHVDLLKFQPFNDHQEVCKPLSASSEVLQYSRVYCAGDEEKYHSLAIRTDSEVHVRCNYLQCRVLLKEDQAAIRIQRWYRNIKFGYQVRRWFLITRGAILTIQAFYRGMKCRQNIFNYQYENRVCFSHKRWQAAVVIQQWWRRIKLCFVLQYDYLVMRGAAIIMQAWIRGTLTRRNYLIMRGACICLQANWRRYCARREYGIYRGAVLFIQCEFRRKLLLQRDLVHYHIMRGAAITIQAFARSYLVRKQISKKKRALVQEQFNDDFKALCSVPCDFLADLPIDQQASFHIMRGAAITIQAWVRGWIARRLIKKALMANQRSLYYQLSYGHVKQGRLASAGEQQLSVPHPLYCNNAIEHDSKHLEQRNQDAIVKIQSMFRMRSIRKKYIKMQVAVRILQVWYRQITLKMKLTLAFKEYSRLVAIRIIQQCWRKYQKRKLALYLFQCRQNIAAVKIQNCWQKRQKRVRAQLLEKKQHTAAVKIQNWWLWVLRRRHTRLLLDKKHKAVSIIQRAARKFTGRKMLKRQMAAIKIQSWVRMLLAHHAYVLAKEVAAQNAQRKAYLNKFVRTVSYNLSVIRIQRAYRFHATRRDRRAAVHIQAVWRGYKVRSGIRDRRISSARQRILSATQSATPDNTLWNRTVTALDYLLHCRNLSTVLVAINDLEVAVRLSSVCCKQLVDVGGVPVLYKLIRGCNRSIPHMEIISGTISILLSLAKFEETKSAVWQDGEVMDVIPEIIRNFREKNPRILTKCCSLFWLLAQSQHYRLVICANCKLVELLQSIHYLACRKAQMEEQRQWHMASLKGHILPVCKGTPSSFRHKALRMPPDWILGKRHMREFEEPVSALSALLKSLNITPKKLQF